MTESDRVIARNQRIIPEGEFIRVKVAVGSAAYIVQEDDESSDQITLDKTQAAQLADMLAAWAHS